MPADGQAEVPFATMVLADATNYRPRSSARPSGQPYDLVVVHITSGRADPKPVAEMWKQPHHGSSAHFVVGQDGTILQAVPMRFAAYHAHDANDHSIGIEHCAREPNEPSFPKGDPGLPPSQAQLTASARLVSYLLKAAGLKPAHGVTILGHKEADPKTTHDQCPDGAPWPWEQYMSMVLAEYEKLDDASSSIV